MSKLVLDRLTTTFSESVLETHSDFGDDTAVVRPERWLDICRWLRTDPAMSFDMLVDLCGVDYPDRVPRIEVVLHLYSIDKRHRLRLKARVGDEEGNGAEIASIVGIWSGANWFERETWDMMGVKFHGHPDLRRILMYPEFEGHPLRKDYPADRTQPLVPYRTEEEAGLPLGKLSPFRDDEGMAFGRKDWTSNQEPS
jgi:NADH-quinone oxidoreductase subunit C